LAIVRRAILAAPAATRARAKLRSDEPLDGHERAAFEDFGVSLAKLEQLQQRDFEDCFARWTGCPS
jgi:hypothetical protein